MNAVEQKVLAEVERREETMISFLQALVRQPSTLGNEMGAQQVVYRKLKSLGLSADLWEPRLDLMRTHPAFAPVEWSYEGRPNVTATHKARGNAGRSLVLNGHIDVVSPEPLWGWTYDPWGAEVVDGRLYGRGAADMKGGIAMMILALESIIVSDVGLLGDVFVETVIEEECCGNGTLACRLRGYSSGADAAIITEPSALGVGFADIGVMWFRVRVRGSSGHVARAHEANNAIEKCFPLIRALRGLEEELNQQITHPSFVELEHPINLNVGTIAGGHWPSSVPAECALTCRLSFEPGVRYQDIRRRVKACVMGAAENDPWLSQEPPQVEFFGFQAEGATLDKDCEAIQLLRRSHRRVTERDARLIARTGLTDLRYFSLCSDIPAPSYGPDGANIHNADEYVDLDSIVTGAKTLALFILDWCGYSGGDGTGRRRAD